MKRTPAELEDALKDLGANVTVQSRDEQFVIAGTTLARNIDATMALVGEMLLQPRWDSGELVLAKAAAAFLGEAGTAGIGNPDLHRAEAGVTAGVMTLSDSPVDRRWHENLEGPVSYSSYRTG